MSLVIRAARNLWRKQIRTLLVILALAISVAAIVSVQTGIEASQANTQEMTAESLATTEDMVESYEAHLERMEEMAETQLTKIMVMNGYFGGMGGGGGTSRSPIPGSAIENIEALSTVEAVIPGVTAPRSLDPSAELVHSGLGDGSGKASRYMIFGILLDEELDEKYQIQPADDDIIEGRKLTPYDTSGIIIKDTIKEALGVDQVGDPVSIDGYDFTVVGIYSDGAGRSGVYMDIATARAIVGLAPDESYVLDVFAANESVVSAAVYDIQVLYPSYMVTSYAEFAANAADRLSGSRGTQLDDLEKRTEEQITRLADELDTIENTGRIVMAVSMITAALIIFFLMYYTVRGRSREIGIYKSLGYTGELITAQFVVEGAIIGFLGGLAGIMLAAVAAPFFSDLFLPSSDAYTSAAPGIIIILAALGGTILLAAIGSVYPAWSATRMKPIEAMRRR